MQANVQERERNARIGRFLSIPKRVEERTSGLSYSSLGVSVRYKFSESVDRGQAKRWVGRWGSLGQDRLAPQRITVLQA